MQTPAKRKTSGRKLTWTSAKKRKVNLPSASVVPRGLGAPSYAQPLRKTLSAKLIYTENFQLSAVAGATASKLFRANGLFSPSVSGGGAAHQPRGFDQLIALYENFYVKQSRIELVVDNGGNFGVAGIGGGLVSINLQQNTTGSSNLNDQLERACITYDTFKNDKFHKLALQADIPKFLGIPAMEDSLKGTTSADPTQQAYWAVVASPLNNAFAVSYNCQIRIIYDCVFVEPIPPPQS
ncbi:MAG: hypothetical protein H7836_17645 [Magnetococcus sp. YQC-3]